MSNINRPQEVIFFELYSSTGVTIKRFEHQNDMFGTPEYVFQLTWTDWVANEYEEFYPALSDALIRVGVLAYCEEVDGVGFNGGQQSFLRPSTILKEQTTFSPVDPSNEVFDYEKEVVRVQNPKGARNNGVLRSVD